MPLESEIIKLTKAIQENTTTVKAFGEAATFTILPQKEEVEEVEEEKVVAKRKPRKKSPTAKKLATTDNSDKSSDPHNPVREALKKVVAAKDRKAASDILTKYGEVTRLTDLEPEKYEAVIQACEDTLAKDKEEEEEEEEEDY